MSCQDYDYYGKYDLKDSKIKYHDYYGQNIMAIMVINIITIMVMIIINSRIKFILLLDTIVSLLYVCGSNYEATIVAILF